MTEQEFFDIGSKQFTEQQLRAIKRTRGATLLLAVPGSGKTTVIVAKTGYMLLVEGIDPKNVLSLTFTKAAANEMSERFAALYGAYLPSLPRFSTINAFCLSVIHICQREKGAAVPELVPNNQQIIRGIVQSITGTYPSDLVVQELAMRICKAKNEMLSGDKLGKIENKSVDFKDAFYTYETYLKDNGLMDFDDQLVLARRFMLDYPDILDRIRKRYLYINLDEAQDTSLIQHKIVQLMAGRSGNLFMVGDEDQSIYGFRGAYPNALLQFKTDYPGNDPELLLMETNYRSDREIVTTANQFIKRNVMRNDKNIVPVSADAGNIQFRMFPDMKNQPEYLVDEVKKALAPGAKGTLAILARNNESFLPLVSQLKKQDIHVRLRDGFATFIQHFFVTDVLNMLRLSLSPRDIDLFMGIYYKLGIYYKKQQLSGIADYLELHPDRSILYYVARIPNYNKFAYRISGIENSFRKIASLPPAKAIHELLFGQPKYWENWVERKIGEGLNEFTLQMKYHTLIKIAEGFQTVREFVDFFDTDWTAFSDASSPVSISTIHSSKGLEFDRVIMIDVIGGLFPICSAKEPDETEEENRLFYVGITRARHDLEFLIPQKYYDLKTPLSEFFKEGVQKKEVS